jgi:5-methylcytosine-specific restriction endonuclease McrA
VRRGPGRTAADGVREGWGGPKAQRYVRLTLAEYGTTCWLCGLPGANSADHIIPISQGGAVYDLANLGPSHRSCNYSRGARSADAYQLIEDGTGWFTRA